MRRRILLVVLTVGTALGTSVLSACNSAGSVAPKGDDGDCRSGFILADGRCVAAPDGP
jgi:hypothetical protein